MSARKVFFAALLGLCWYCCTVQAQNPYSPANMPAQYAGANLTFAAFQLDAPVIDPSGFEGRPKEPLKVTAFTQGLPSPAFYASHLDAVRKDGRVSRL